MVLHFQYHYHSLKDQDTAQLLLALEPGSLRDQPNKCQQVLRAHDILPGKSQLGYPGDTVYLEKLD